MTITKGTNNSKPPPPPGAPNITQRIQAMQLAARYHHTSEKQQREKKGQNGGQPARSKNGGVKLVLPPKPPTQSLVDANAKIPSDILIPMLTTDDKQQRIDAKGRRVLGERNVIVRFVRRSKTNKRNGD